MSDQEIEELKALVLTDRKERRGPFSKQVRERVQGYLKKKWRSGVSLKRVGQELGLSDHTVQYWRARWSERGEEGAKLRRVEVVAESAPSARVVTVHGPAGTRVDGLSLDEVTTLWRKLQ